MFCSYTTEGFECTKQTDDNQVSWFQESRAGLQQSFSPAVSQGKCFVVCFICKAPEMWGLHIYFSANGLNGLLRTLNGCVSSMQLQLYQQNSLFIRLFTLNYMYFGH